MVDGSHVRTELRPVVPVSPGGEQSGVGGPASSTPV